MFYVNFELPDRTFHFCLHVQYFKPASCYAESILQSLYLNTFLKFDNLSGMI